MMISPDVYISDKKDMSYKELLKERDILLKEIYDFENDKIPDENYIINPSPEVIYQCNLRYLVKLCELIAEKYNKEIIWSNKNE